MRNWYIYILLAFSLSPFAYHLSPKAYGQIDTEFWFAAPSLTTSHTPANIWMVVVTYGDAANVSITQPARNRTLMTERRIEANSTFTYSLKSVMDYRNVILTAADQQVHDNGVLVQSSVPVSVYFVTTAENSEVYTLKGRHGLGTDFVVPMQFRYKSNHTQPAYCSIEMVASEDNTTITVETTQPTNCLPTAGTITITLNRGQSYAIRSLQANTPANQHLGGTRIRSDKPIAVNTTDDSAETGNDKDLVGEQLVPAIRHSSRYIAVSNNSDHEYVYFFAIDDSSSDIYTTDGTTQTLLGTIAPNQPLEYKLQKRSAQMFYTQDNAPFVCYQLTGNGGELSGTELPSLNCSGSDEVSYIPALNTVASNVTVLTRTEFVAGFTVNGSDNRLPASVFLPVPGAPEWSYTPSTIIQMADNERTLRIRNHLGVFHLGVLDATQGAVSYGFFSNFGMISMSCKSLNDYYYAGDDVHLHLVAPETYDSIWWEGPRGLFGFNDGSPIIQNATMADAGRYVVNGIHSEGCELTPDTFYLTVLDTVASYRREEVCYGDEAVIHSTGEKPFEWYQDDQLMPAQKTDTYIYTPTTSSTFIISSTTPGIDIFASNDTVAYIYDEQQDTMVVWNQTYVHCMPNVEYVYTVSLGVDGTNPVPPRLLLYVNGVYSEVHALPNNCSGHIITLRFTPKDRYAVMRLVAVNTRIGRHFQIESMSLKPVLPLTETIVLDTIHCEADPITFTMDAAMEVCDGDWSVVWPIQIKSGQPELATISYNQQEYQLPVNRSTQELEIPIQALPNRYAVKVVLSSPKYASTDTQTGQLTVLYDPMKVFAHKWNNVLAIYSPEYSGYPAYTWSEYRWYKDGVDLNQSFSIYRIADGTFNPEECYQLLLTRQQDGVQLMTCPYCIAPAAKQNDAPGRTATKILRNGQLIITIDGTSYNAYGTRL